MLRGAAKGTASRKSLKDLSIWVHHLTIGKVVGNQSDPLRELARDRTTENSTLRDRRIPKIVTVGWLALGIASVALALIAVVVLRSERESTAVLHHLNLLALNLQDVLSDLAEAEAGEREYLLTGRPSSFEDFQRSRKALDLEFDRLAVLVKDNLAERNEVERVRDLVQQDLDELQRSASSRTAAGSQSVFAEILTGRARKLTEALRQTIAGIDREDESTLARMARRRRVRLASALGAVSGALLLSGCYLLLGQIIVTRSASRNQRTEEALSASEKRFETLCEQAPVGIYSTNAHGLCVYTNVRWSQISGLSAAESLGHGWTRALHPDDRERVFQGWETAARQGTTWEYRLLSAQGETRWIRATGGPIYSDRGELTGFVGTVEDVTDRHESQELLRKSEERFRVTFFQAAVGIAQTSVDGQWLLINDRFCEILGYTRDQLCEKTFLDITHPDDREASLTARDKLLSGEISSWSSEKQYIRKDGVTIWGRVFVSVVRDQHEQAQYFVAVVEDMTAQKEAERALQQSRKELRALAGRLINAEEDERKRISRELHDDLCQKLALLAFDTGGLVLVPPSNVKEMKESLRNLQTRVVKLAEDVRQLSHQLHSTILEDLGLNAALNELCEEFSAREGIEVAFEALAVPKPLPLAVEACLYRISQEALHNVLKHAQAGQVTLRISGSPKGIHLYIHDNGIGFDPEVAKSRAGLGIVSMKERATLVQGEFSISSQPGKGAEIRVFVPLSKEIA
jgi:PAS domain S-box-containing protein